MQRLMDGLKNEAYVPSETTDSDINDAKNKEMFPGINLQRLETA